MENQNKNPKDQLIERLKTSNNVLVTVSRNPSVDQLSAAIGLTVMLNQMDKHATAVFSGEVPDTLEFLKPEETLEKNTDSLRDFIISLDKAKADKLRYKVEDTYVKIFITPYKTSLSEADLVFGQGDFNVDVVVALGVHEKEDLDQAITNHGRILHDAVVATVNTTSDGQIGTINWVDQRSSSLSEMLVPVCEALKAESLDAQIATAFLTGIVSETERFSNEKTSSDTMNVSAKLMAAGANQQLVATKLEQAVAVPSQDQPEQVAPENNDGSLEIEHMEEPESPADLPEVRPQQNQDEQPPVEEDEEPKDDEHEPSRLILEPPTLGGKLTANAEPEALDPSTDPLTLRPTDQPILTHDKDEEKSEEPVAPQPPIDEPEAPLFPTPPLVPAEDSDTPVIPELAPPPKAEEQPVPEEQAPQPVDAPEEMTETPESVPEKPIEDHQTLTELEAAVDSPHTDVAEAAAADAGIPQAPDADAALAAAHEALEAAAVTEASPADEAPKGEMDVSHEETPANEPQAPPMELSIDPATGEISYPENIVPKSNELPSDPTAATVTDPTAPPPVPPPMSMPPLMPPAEPPADTIDPNNLPPVEQ